MVEHDSFYRFSCGYVADVLSHPEIQARQGHWDVLFDVVITNVTPLRLPQLRRFGGNPVLNGLC